MEISFLKTWAATLIMTVVNYLIPYILGHMSVFEEWDFAEEQLNSDLWKNYFTSILNIIVFCILQYNYLLL